MGRKKKSLDDFINNPSTFELLIHDNPSIGEKYAVQAISTITGHTLLQCVQIATVTTQVGKCNVKISKDVDELMAMQHDFNALGIGATIQLYEPSVN